MGSMYIMWIRQLKRYWRSKARMISSLGQPLLFLIALGFGFGPIYEKAGGGSYIQFLAPGIIAMSILFTAMFTGIEVIWDRRFGFLKETLVAPVSRTAIMIGRTLGGATVATIQGVIVLLICTLIGFKITNWFMLPVIIFGMFLIAMFFTALGTAIASHMEDMQAFPLIMNFLVMPIFFLSGALFPLADLPSALKFITYINPLAYGIEFLRWALTGLSTHLPIFNFSILLGLTVLILIVGSYLFSTIEI